jgi:hypothetical protein
MNCTGSPDMNEGKVSTTSRYAAEGTQAHEHAERILNDVAAGHVGTKTFDMDDDDMLNAVCVYTKYCAQLMSEADEYHIEKTVTLDNLYWNSKPPEPLFGTADFAAAIKTTLHVVDYKHGKGIPVDAEGNPQLAYYGLGTFFAMTKGNENRFTDVELTIIQPRAAHADGAVRTWYLSVEELMAWGKAFKGKIDKIAAYDTLLKAGTWCRFCPSMGDCPEAHRKAVEGARLDFAAVPKDKPETLANGDLVDILEGMEFAQNWLKAIAAEAQGRLERGGKLDGWKLVAKRATRRWVDEDAAGIWALAALSPSQQDMAVAPRKLLSPAQMEKMLKTLSKQLPADLVEKKSSGVTLAPESDQRPGVASGPKVEFTSVSDET